MEARLQIVETRQGTYSGTSLKSQFVPPPSQYTKLYNLGQSGLSLMSAGILIDS